MKLSLGSAQFGMNYGVTNKFGQTNAEQVAKILDIAKNNNILNIDTAPSYGESEKVLGLNNLEEFNIFSKVIYVENERIHKSDIQDVEIKFMNSLKTLGVDDIQGLFVHNVVDMFKEGSSELYNKLLEFKERGLIKQIGVSIYEKDEIEKIFEDFYFDIVQVPINVLDQRLVKSNTLKNLKKENVEVHARSIFLQGILLDDLTTTEQRFKELSPLIRDYFRELSEKDLTKVEGALSFINSISEIDLSIIGVNNICQFKEIITAYNNVKADRNPGVNFSKYECFSNLIDPRKW